MEHSEAEAGEATYSALIKARLAAAEARTARVEAGLSATRSPIERAEAAPTSLRAAVDAKCYDCVGRDTDPCWQWRVGSCGCSSCPLHPHRPYRHHEGTPTPPSLA